MYFAILEQRVAYCGQIAVLLWRGKLSHPFKSRPHGDVEPLQESLPPLPSEPPPAPLPPLPMDEDQPPLPPDEASEARLATAGLFEPASHAAVSALAPPLPSPGLGTPAAPISTLLSGLNEIPTVCSRACILRCTVLFSLDVLSKVLCPDQMCNAHCPDCLCKHSCEACHAQSSHCIAFCTAVLHQAVCFSYKAQYVFAQKDVNPEGR